MRKSFVMTAAMAVAVAFVSATAASAAAPVGRTLYVTNSDTSGGSIANVSRFTINADGTLTLVDSVPAGHVARTMAITPSRGLAYVTASNANEVDGYRIGPDGSLTRFLTVSRPNPSGGVIAPDGRFLYIDNQALYALTVFAFRRVGALVGRARSSASSVARPSSRPMAGSSTSSAPTPTRCSGCASAAMAASPR